jgi:hypothetical protein
LGEAVADIEFATEVIEGLPIQIEVHNKIDIHLLSLL